MRAYENNDEPERCPVRPYKEYMAHVAKDAPGNCFCNSWKSFAYSFRSTRETLDTVLFYRNIDSRVFAMFDPLDFPYSFLKMTDRLVFL